MIKSKKGIEIRELIKEKDFNITRFFNEKWLSNRIVHPMAQIPGLALAGFLINLDKNRIQIFGKTEIDYLSQINPEEAKKLFKNFIAVKIPGIIVAEDQPVPDFMIHIANQNKIPVIVSGLRSSLLMARISSFLYIFHAKKTRINGVFMDIMGIGVLITGKSGIGKSETAIELINRGHRLVSDDLIEFYEDSNDDLIGRSIKTIQKWLEVRGLGIINIVEIFGADSFMEKKKLDLVINLEKWNVKKKYDRLGEEKLFFTLLGKDTPMFIIPVALGRNMSTLIEVAVKYFISRKNGGLSFAECVRRKEK